MAEKNLLKLAKGDDKKKTAATKKPTLILEWVSQTYKALKPCGLLA